MPATVLIREKNGAASECMTTNITWWAGQVLRGIAERLNPPN